MPKIEDIPIAIVAAVARYKGHPLPSGGSGSEIFGQASGGVIGRDCSIPWHLPADLAHFRKLTIDKTIIMGRRTYESIGRPLDRRINIVLSSRPGYRADGCIAASSFEESIEKAASDADPDRTKNDIRPRIMIIGGESIYHQAIAMCRHIRFYLTLVDTAIEKADSFFPEFDPSSWRKNHYRKYDADARNQHDIHFFDLIRISRSQKFESVKENTFRISQKNA